MNCLFEVENIFDKKSKSDQISIFNFGKAKSLYQHIGTLIMTDGAVRKYNLSWLEKQNSSLDTKIKNSILIGYLSMKILKIIINLSQFIRADSLINTNWDNLEQTTNYYFYPGMTKNHRMLIGSLNAYHPNLNVKNLIKIIGKYTNELPVYIL
jgi:hypothetical protein